MLVRETFEFFKDLKKKKRKKDRKKKVTLTLTDQRVEKILHRLFILRQTCWWLLSSEALGFQSEPKSLKILLIFFIPTKSTNLHCKGSNCGVIMHYKKATTPKETFNHRITKTKPYCRTNYFIISLHHSIVHSNSLSTLCKHIYSTPTPQHCTMHDTPMLPTFHYLLTMDQHIKACQKKKKKKEETRRQQPKAHLSTTYNPQQKGRVSVRVWTTHSWGHLNLS